jgi:hypothetical protein
MPNKKVVPVRFYANTDEDLIEWLEGLAVGEGNDTIKAMLRAGIAASQNGNGRPTQPTYGASIATLDPASLQSALEDFLPRIREIVDASLASTNFTLAGNDTASRAGNTASADLLKGHLVGEDEDD